MHLRHYATSYRRQQVLDIVHYLGIHQSCTSLVARVGIILDISNVFENHIQRGYNTEKVSHRIRKELQFKDLDNLFAKKSSRYYTYCVKARGRRRLADVQKTVKRSQIVFQ